jgi:hypothetical protein
MSRPYALPFGPMRGVDNNTSIPREIQDQAPFVPIEARRAQLGFRIQERS